MKKNSNYIYIYFIKIFICIIIFLILAIICKKDSVTKEKIYNYIYGSSIDFSAFKNIYNKYLGGIFYIDIDKNKFNSEMSVFDNKIKYDKLESYEDGVRLDVNRNYLIPSIDEGIVVYIGKKDKYGNVVIVENGDGVDTWYGNVCNFSFKLYDNITKYDYIGEACDNFIYLVFSKNNNFLDYRGYIG